MTFDITQIVVAIIGTLGIIITNSVVSLIKAKVTTERWTNIVAWTRTAVQAAEIIYEGSGRGEEKRNYVLNWVAAEAKKRGMKIDTDTISVALEDAWNQLTKGI